MRENTACPPPAMLLSPHARTGSPRAPPSCTATSARQMRPRRQPCGGICGSSSVTHAWWKFRASPGGRSCTASSCVRAPPSRLPNTAASGPRRARPCGSGPRSRPCCCRAGWARSGMRCRCAMPCVTGRTTSASNSMRSRPRGRPASCCCRPIHNTRPPPRPASSMLCMPGPGGCGRYPNCVSSTTTTTTRCTSKPWPRGYANTGRTTAAHRCW